ncbi:MAG TPA: zf-HC2 domain-containing protein [Streptosporangiaceae bacterium]|nr:zf-HC2 domain-containing protein [Streptosporangiaceae bacterium]
MRFPRGRNHDIACQQAVEMVSDYLEDALERAEKQRFEKHLSVCPHCTEYLAQVRETIRLAGRLTPDDLSQPMREAFTDLYRRWRAEG